MEALDARLATASVAECWSNLDHSEVSWWCEHVAPTDLVKRPALIALWARAHEDAGRMEDALTASRVACSLVDPDVASPFIEAEEQFQRELIERTGGAPQEEGPVPDQATLRLQQDGLGAKPSATTEGPLYYVTLFGGLEVQVGGTTIDLTRWRNNKARTLLVSILIEQGREVSRDVLLDRLWPGRDLPSALNNFYVTWNAMKRALIPEAQEDGTVLPMPVVNAGQRCSLVRSRCQLDLDDFDEHLSAARSEAGSGDASEALRCFLKLATVYRGQLLCGDVYAEWIAPYREYYRTQFLDAMVQASTLAAEHGSNELALMFSIRGLAVDSHSEAATACFMRACMLMGKREDGIRAYHQCRNYLSEELGLDPSEKMQDLYREIIGG